MKIWCETTDFVILAFTPCKQLNQVKFFNSHHYSKAGKFKSNLSILKECKCIREDSECRCDAFQSKYSFRQSWSYTLLSSL